MTAPLRRVTRPDLRAPTEIRVGMARLAVATGDEVLVAIGLGSCVAIVLWDERIGVAGLAHVVLPGPELSRTLGTPARFPATAVPALLAAMAERGAAGTPTARLVGGASMFGALLASNGVNVGARNVAAARAAVAAAGLPLTAEDVGGEHGRSVYLHARGGRLRVRSTARGDREL